MQNCKIYDLSKSLNYPILHSFYENSQIYSQIYDDISNSMKNSDDKDFRRLVIRIKPDTWKLKDLNTFLVSLRYLVRSLNICCVITALMDDSQNSFVLRKNSDFVVAVKDFENQQKFEGFCGLLEIVKPLRLQSLGNYELTAQFYGIVRDNKFIHVENLSLPPAESLQNHSLDY